MRLENYSAYVGTSGPNKTHVVPLLYGFAVLACGAGATAVIDGNQTIDLVTGSALPSPDRQHPWRSVAFEAGGDADLWLALYDHAGDPPVPEPGPGVHLITQGAPNYGSVATGAALAPAPGYAQDATTGLWVPVQAAQPDESILTTPRRRAPVTLYSAILAAGSGAAQSASIDTSAWRAIELRCVNKDAANPATCGVRIDDGGYWQGYALGQINPPASGNGVHAWGASVYGDGTPVPSSVTVSGTPGAAGDLQVELWGME